MSSITNNLNSVVLMKVAINICIININLSTDVTIDETVIDDGEFHMEELVTFGRAPHDHDYQMVKRTEPRAAAAPAAGYADLPIDEDWPPALKKRIKLHFDYDDGKDYIPPIVTQKSYQNANKIQPKDAYANNLELMIDKVDGFLRNNFLSAGRKFGEMLDVLSPVPVHSEDILLEEVADHDARNITDIKQFVVNNTI